MTDSIIVQRDGPRGWHRIDRAKYDANPSAYVVCDETGKPVAKHPLDHDGNQKKGGAVVPPSELSVLRKQYKAKFGNGPSPKWDADTLRTKLAE